jgi:DNA-binding transcriptional ArsR family regulator
MTARPPQERADDTDDVFAALADRTRRALLDALVTCGGAASATTLAAELPITRQAVVKHLAVLDRAGLVHGTRQGREMRYAVRPDRLDATARALADLAAEWDSRLQAIKRVAEND